jgi:hypothetical protein
MTYKFILPLAVYLPRKTKEDRKIMLNMNIYRNLHHSVNHQIKKLFTPELLNGQLRTELLKDPRPVKISYVVEKKTKRKFDTMNIVSIVDKFFLDWMVENNYLEDDSFKHVSYGSITGSNDCKYNRVIAYIEIIK